MASKADERFVIDGDPEDALRGVLKVDPGAGVREFIIDIMAADETGMYPGVGNPKARRMHWSGLAVDEDAATVAAWAAWHEKYGPEKPSNAVTATRPLAPSLKASRPAWVCQRTQRPKRPRLAAS